METKVTKMTKVEFDHEGIVCTLEINSENKSLISAQIGGNYFFGETGLRQMDSAYQALIIFKENI